MAGMSEEIVNESGQATMHLLSAQLHAAFGSPAGQTSILRDLAGHAPINCVT